MRGVVLSAQRTRPGWSPEYFARVDTSHPLAAGLVLCVLPGAAVETVNGYTITRVGGPTLVGSPLGAAWSFNGSSQGVQVSGAALGGIGNCTWAWWGDCGASTTRIAIETSANFNSTNSLISYVDSGNTTVVGSSLAATAVTTTSVGTGWRNILGRRGPTGEMLGGNGGNLHADGAYVAAGSAASATHATGQTVNIGCRNGSSLWFSGRMGPVMIWSRHLSTREIAALYADPFQMLRW